MELFVLECVSDYASFGDLGGVQCEVVLKITRT